MKTPGVENRSVLITGCSSGIGAATARVLRAAGWQVIPTARRAADLDRLREAGFTPVRIDLADAGSVDAAFAEATALAGGGLGALVNNAGFGQAGAQEDVARDALRMQFEVNVFGMQQLARLCIPGFRERGAGRIVNVSSVLGRVTLPMLGCYCASKYAMESLSDAMRMELRGSGVWVSLVEPGPIVSAFRRTAATLLVERIDTGTARYGRAYEAEAERRRGREKRAGLITRPPEAVAARIRHALESPFPRRRYRITLPAYAGDWIARLVPAAVTDRLLTRNMPRPEGR